ncbi:MAG: single-stranded DNA-binding protein [Fidelibacterota bacterium]
MQKGSINRVILVGHLGSDPETRFTTAGNAVATFNLATNESWKNSEGNYEDKTEWHRCVFFGKLAETAKDILQKGQLIYMEGRLRTRQWEDKDNVKRYTTEVVGDMFTMLGRKMNSETGNKNQSSEDSDLPF